MCGIAAVGAGADTKSDVRARRLDEVESIKSCLRAYRLYLADVFA
jgi:hypothetical protein